MRSERRKKVMTLSILAISILTISIGFAVFSSTLNIKSTASISPDASNFKVVFSNKSNAVDTSNVIPTKTPTTIGASEGVINNTTNPTLTGLEADFTAPGQKAVYNLYVYNAGEFIAYLNSVTLKGNKSCTPGEGASIQLVGQACEDITVTVKVGNDSYNKTTTGITGKSIGVGESTPIQITIEYLSGGALADGPFSVEFNDISLFYETVAGQGEQYTGESGTLYTGVIYRNSEEDLSIDDSIDTISEYETSLSNISQNVYLKHEIVNNIVTTSYACITNTENGIRKDVCLRAGEEYYASNQEIIHNIESYVVSAGGSCRFNDSYSSCDAYVFDTGLEYDLEFWAYSDGSVGSLYGDDSVTCSVESDGRSSCGI